MFKENDLVLYTGPQYQFPMIRTEVSGKVQRDQHPDNGMVHVKFFPEQPAFIVNPDELVPTWDIGTYVRYTNKYTAIWEPDSGALGIITDVSIGTQCPYSVSFEGVGNQRYSPRNLEPFSELERLTHMARVAMEQADLALQALAGVYPEGSNGHRNLVAMSRYLDGWDCDVQIYLENDWCKEPRLDPRI